MFCDVQNININSMLPAHLSFFINGCSNYSSSSKNRIISSIKSFFKWLHNNKIIKDNPSTALRIYSKTVKQSTLAFTDEEAHELKYTPNLNQIGGNWHNLALILLFNLGLRRSELVNIKVGDIKDDRGYKILNILGKGNKIRAVTLNDHVQNAINDYLRRYSQLTGHILSDNDYLLQKGSKLSNKPINTSTVLRMVKKYAKMIGVDRRVSPHSCRATVISHLLEKKVSIRNVADLAGHSSIVTTQLYDKKRDGYSNSASFEVNYEGCESI